MVYNNQEQAKVWDVGISFLGNLNYYLIPSIYIIILAWATRLKQISRDLLLMLIGFSFAVLLVFIPPMPGWYYWILPFFIYFNIREQKFSFYPDSSFTICVSSIFCTNP